MKKNYRQGRLSEEIKKIISDLLYMELKDPRLAGLVSITDVKAVRDGSFATVYVSVLEGTAAASAVAAADDSEESQAKELKHKSDVIDAFNSAKGLIRKEIGTQLKLRHTPDLIFKIDTSEEYGRHIDKIIGELMTVDNAADGEQ